MNDPLIEIDSTYNKPSLEVSQLVDRLAEGGVNIGDREWAREVVSNIGYYRLSGYLYHFRDSLSGTKGKSHTKYFPGTRLDRVCDIYEFDTKLRMYLFEVLGEIEVALRCVIKEQLATRGAFSHLQLGPPSLSPDPQTSQVELLSDLTDGEEISEAGSNKEIPYVRWVNSIRRTQQASKEQFAVHIKSKYGPDLPVWAAIELMTFGELTLLYAFSPLADQKIIAMRLDLIDEAGEGDSQTLNNWLNHLRHARNICAHHGRLWRRSLSVPPRIPDYLSEFSHVPEEDKYRAYLTFAICRFIGTRCTPHSESLLESLGDLCRKASSLGVNLKDDLAFPVDWMYEELWLPDYSPDRTLRELVKASLTLECYTTEEARNQLDTDCKTGDYRNKKARKSWLDYINKKNATIYFELGTKKTYPKFQFRYGDLDPWVGSINEKLIPTAVGSTKSERIVSTFNWWITPLVSLGGIAPIDAVGNPAAQALIEALLMSP